MSNAVPTATTCTPPLIENPAVVDVLSSYNNVYTYGALLDFNLALFNESNGMFFDHVQGAAYYRNTHVTDSRECDYFALFATNDEFDTAGSIIACNLQNREQTLSFDTFVGSSNPPLNHPGGMQVIGDYLVIGIEPGHGSTELVSRIAFYDLSVMTSTLPPTLMHYAINRSAGKAGAVGITRFPYAENDLRYILAVYDNGKVDFYLSVQGFDLSQNVGGNQFTFISSTQATDSSYNGIGLVTEATTNNIYMVGFRTDESDWSDYADLIHVELNPDRSVTLIDIAQRHMITEHGLGSADVHFRFGSGVTFDEEGRLNFLATQRNGTLGFFFSNLFTQVDSTVRVKVYSNLAEKQNSRVSDNFTLNNGKQQIIWGVEGLTPGLSDAQIAKIRFTVIQDIKSGNDKAVTDELSVGSITKGKLVKEGTSRMYIGRLKYDGVEKEDAIIELANSTTATSKDGYYFYFVTQAVPDDNMQNG
jgi:hypothetical protein